MQPFSVISLIFAQTRLYNRYSVHAISSNDDTCCHGTIPSTVVCPLPTHYGTCISENDIFTKAERGYRSKTLLHI